MSEVINRQLLASLAIVAALALVGAIAAQVLVVQEAFADAKKQGCHPSKGGSSGPSPSFFNSGGKDDKGPGTCAKLGPD